MCPPVSLVRIPWFGNREVRSYKMLRAEHTEHLSLVYYTWTESQYTCIFWVGGLETTHHWHHPCFRKGPLKCGFGTVELVMEIKSVRDCNFHYSELNQTACNPLCLFHGGCQVSRRCFNMGLGHIYIYTAKKKNLAQTTSKCGRRDQISNAFSAHVGGILTCSQSRPLVIGSLQMGVNSRSEQGHCLSALFFKPQWFE